MESMESTEINLSGTTKKKNNDHFVICKWVNLIICTLYRKSNIIFDYYRFIVSRRFLHYCFYLDSEPFYSFFFQRSVTYPDRSRDQFMTSIDRIYLSND